MLWLAGLIVMWLISPTYEPLRLIFGVLAGLRLLEIFTTGLGTILQASQQIRARNVLTILTYAIQATFIFAILYHSFAAAGFDPEPHLPSEFLYISWSAIVSLGNESFAAEGASARFLEVATTTSSIFLFGVLLAFGIDAVKKGKEAQRGVSGEPGRTAHVSLSVEHGDRPKWLRVRLDRRRGRK